MAAQEAVESLSVHEEEDEETGQAIDLPRRDVYDLSTDACRVAIWTYLIADLRDLADQGKLKGEEVQEKLAMPLHIQEMQHVFEQNKEAVQEAHLGKDENLFTDAINFWANRDDDDSNTRNDSASTNEATGEGSRMLEFYDDHKESQCVYGIGISPPLKSIMVSFRGSVTPKDWMIDSQAWFSDIPNPLFEVEEGQPEYVGIHHGFFDYLYFNHDEQTNNSPQIKLPRQRVRRDAIGNKMQAILQSVAVLLQDNPGYSLMCTGHSLGGALATVCAFEAAASLDPRITKPVTCVTIAAPAVGNLCFRSAVELLQRKRKLFILRVANFGDVVPYLPPRGALCCTKGYMESSYHHAGPLLFLRPKWMMRGYSLTNCTAYEMHFCRLLVHQVIRDVKQLLFLFVVVPLLCVVSCKAAVDTVKAHSSLTYLKRLELYKSELEKLYLDEVFT